MTCDERWLRGNGLRPRWLKGNGLRPKGWRAASKYMAARILYPAAKPQNISYAVLYKFVRRTTPSGKAHYPSATSTEGRYPSATFSTYAPHFHRPPGTIFPISMDATKPLDIIIVPLYKLTRHTTPSGEARYPSATFSTYVLHFHHQPCTISPLFSLEISHSIQYNEDKSMHII